MATGKIILLVCVITLILSCLVFVIGMKEGSSSELSKVLGNFMFNYVNRFLYIFHCRKNTLFLETILDHKYVDSHRLSNKLIFAIILVGNLFIAPFMYILYPIIKKIRSKLMYKDIKRILKERFNYTVDMNKFKILSLQNKQEAFMIERMFLEEIKTYLELYQGAQIIFSHHFSTKKIQKATDVKIERSKEVETSIMLNHNINKNNFLDRNLGHRNDLVSRTTSMQQANQYLERESDDSTYFNVFNRNTDNIKNTGGNKIFPTYTAALKSAIYELLIAYEQVVKN